LFDFKKWHPTFAEKQMKAFLEVTPKKVFSSRSYREKIYRQKSHNNVSGKFGKSRAKILRTPKLLLAPTPIFLTTMHTVIPFFQFPPQVFFKNKTFFSK